MRISRRKPAYKKPPTQNNRYRTNDRIRSEQVRLIDETGQNHGVIATARALEMALERGLDLIEVSPLANPPVVKIVDYSKLRYQEEKAKRQERAKQKKIEIKGIRLSLRIGEGDKNIRIKQAVKFLEDDDKVRIEMNLRGREKAHKDLAYTIVKGFIEKINQTVETISEQPTTIMGGKVSTLIAKKK